MEKIEAAVLEKMDIRLVDRVDEAFDAVLLPEENPAALQSAM